MRKNITFKSLCLLGAMVFAGFGANAQYSHTEISFYVPGFSIPVSDFGSKADKFGGNDVIPLGLKNMGKEAGFGFGGGLRYAYRFDIGFGEIAPFVGAELYWNRVKSDYRDLYDDNDATAPYYINIPIYFGVNYRYQLTDIFTPFGEFGFGPDLMLMHKESDGNADYKYKNNFGFGWQIGGGTYLNKRFSLGLHYYSFGSHKIKYRNKPDYAAPLDYTVTKTQKRRIGSLMIRFGFHF